MYLLRESGFAVTFYTRRYIIVIISSVSALTTPIEKRPLRDRATVATIGDNCGSFRGPGSIDGTTPKSLVNAGVNRYVCLVRLSSYEITRQ